MMLSLELPLLHRQQPLALLQFQPWEPLAEQWWTT
jgi:hypothetical protein